MTSTDNTGFGPVPSDDRFSSSSHCPACDGHPGLQHGQGVRCTGYLAADSIHFFCTREEFAGDLSPIESEVGDLYRHLLTGACPCGEDHGERPSAAVPAEPGPRSPSGAVSSQSWRSSLSDGGFVEKVRFNKVDGSKGYAWSRDGKPGLGGLKPREVPLYNSESLAALRPDASVVMTEGEKAADALLGAGIHALGTACGAAVTPSDEVLAVLTGRPVVLWPDNDDPGRIHMDNIGRALQRLGAVVSVIVWNAAPAKGDAFDAMAAGEDVAKLIASAAPFAPASKLPFKRVKDFLSAVPDRPAYVAKPYFAEGTVTLLHGDPKAGKSTLAMGVVRSVLFGEDFLKEPVTPGPVVYLTEEHAATFGHPLRLAGVEQHSDLHILDWPSVSGVPWADVVAEALEYAESVGARLLVIDPFAHWAGFAGDGEQDSAAILKALKPLLRGRRAGFCILLVHHSRKAGGGVISGARGSSAVTGGVDVVLDLGHERGMRDNARALRASGRLPALPARRVIELQGGRYRALRVGEAAGIIGEAQVLAGLPTDATDPIGVEQLALALGAGKTSVQAILNALMEDGRAVVTGEGKKGDPKRYYRVDSDSAESRDSAAAEETPEANSDV